MKLEASIVKKMELFVVTCWGAKDTCRTPEQQWVYLAQEAEQHFTRLFASTYCSSWILQKPSRVSLAWLGCSSSSPWPWSAQEFTLPFTVPHLHVRRENVEIPNYRNFPKVPDFLWLFWVVSGRLCWAGRAAEQGNRAEMAAQGKLEFLSPSVR